MVQQDKQKSKLTRRSLSLRENLLRRKKAVKSRDKNDEQESFSNNDIQEENDHISAPQ